MSTWPAVIPFDPTLIRATLPEYSDPVKYPDALLQMYWDHAICLADPSNCGMVIDCSRALMINLLTGHLIYVFEKQASKGKQGGFQTSSTVDKVSVSRLAPPATDMFSWWLSQSPRGQELLALLEIFTVGGLYIGGHDEDSSFRKAGGVF